jgi:long-chain acyl-CoA synthetase
MGYNKIDNSTEHKLWDKLVFGKMKSALGGNVRIAATGGAPISTEVL